MNNIAKSFEDNTVLKDVNLSVRPGEIVALVGENGAGKSTLLNILFGMPVIHNTGGFSGDIQIEGRSVRIMDPMQAMKYGIGMVHQEFMLINGFTVAENIKLNRENVKETILGRIFGERANPLDYSAMHLDAQATLDSLKLDINRNTIVGDLSVGYKQFVEISRELDKKNIKLIVLDEPTAVLTEIEADRFLDCVRSVAQRGISFIFVSHRLGEVKQLANRIVILRDGEKVGDYPKDELSVLDISRLMVGREIRIRKRPTGGDYVSQESGQDFCVEVERLSVDMVGDASSDISFRVRRGEIFGIGGLAGHGKASIANGLFGMYPARGMVKINSEDVELGNTRKTLAMGVAFLSEDRRDVGLALDESIEMNIVLGAMRIKNAFTKKICGIDFYDRKSAASHTRDMIHSLDIRCTGKDQPVGSLSGGNQQKVCIARALTQQADILFVSEPTRGIDVGAKEMVLDTLLQLNKDKQVTIILTSSELVELRSICDRIAIVTEGRIAGILKPSDDDYKFGLLMSGNTIDAFQDEEHRAGLK
jgi:simple sugar transport system ATP-binding protein